MHTILEAPLSLEESIRKSYGIVLAGHGSRDAEGVCEFEKLVELVREQSTGRIVTHGFLEFAKPTIDEAVRANISAGSKHVVVVPAVLLAATHAKNDMPSEVQALRSEFPDIQIDFAAALNIHPLVLRLIREKIITAESRSSKKIDRSDTCLVIAGRGTTDSDANSDVSKLARMLEEGMGFGASFVCYSGTAKPLVADGLKLAVKMGFARLMVAPFFLFTGVLVKRIYAAVDEMAAKHPRQEFLKCDYLGIHAHIANAFLERAAECVEGKADMNCSLCKYRVQIVGQEAAVGTPQQGHHFHVRAQGSPLISAANPKVDPRPYGYEMHPIEKESFALIENGRDWSSFHELDKRILQRLVHTSGEFGIVDDVFISSGAADAGIRGLRKRACIATDVTMVQSGLRRSLLSQLGLEVYCGVHDEEARLLAEANGLTRSAAGIRLARQKYGNDLILLIGDAPTAVEEAVRLVQEQQWRPHLIIGLPVGFIGTEACKEKLKRCLSVPRITNRGTRGGSPWAAAALNALLIEVANMKTPQSIELAT